MIEDKRTLTSDFWTQHPEVAQGYAQSLSRLRSFIEVSEGTKDRALQVLVDSLGYSLHWFGHAPKAPMTFGSRNGTVDFEWETEGRDLWIMIPESGSIEYFSESRDGLSPLEQEGFIADSDVPGLVAWLAGGRWPKK